MTEAASSTKIDHFGVAEQGKLFALQNKHELALIYYRQAIQLAVARKEPEVVFRHYLECSLESLELMGSYADVLAYCDKAIAHYEQNKPRHRLAHMDLAAIHQRKAMLLAKTGQTAEASRQIDLAMAEARKASERLPLSESMRRWMSGGLHLKPERITQEQKKHHYFSVREDAVDASRAVELPAGVLAQAAAGCAPGTRRP